jgi:hypothetical protein
MTLNGIRPKRRSLGQNAMIRARVGMGFETAGRTRSAAEASRDTAAFFGAGSRHRG